MQKTFQDPIGQIKTFLRKQIVFTQSFPVSIKSCNNVGWVKPHLYFDWPRKCCSLEWSVTWILNSQLWFEPYPIIINHYWLLGSPKKLTRKLVKQNLFQQCFEHKILKALENQSASIPSIGELPQCCWDVHKFHPYLLKHETDAIKQLKQKRCLTGTWEKRSCRVTTRQARGQQLLR